MCKSSQPMDATNNRRKKPSSSAAAQPTSNEARLSRSRSGAPTAMAAAADPRLMINSTSSSKQQVGPFSSSQRYNNYSSSSSGGGLRSKSTTKSRASSVSSVDSSLEFERDASSRGGHGSSSSRRVRTAPPSPSAWSRSPGRGPLFNTIMMPTNKHHNIINNDHIITNNKAAATTNTSVNSNSRSRGSSSISKVFKYFRSQKKVSPSQAEDLHNFRIFHNTLLQWRFANARAEAAMAAIQHRAQERLVKVWIEMWELRESVAEKQMEMQQVVALIKLHEILIPQIYLLQEWPTLEAKYSVGLSRIIRKLSAFSCLVPTLDGAHQVDDVYAVKEAMAQALQVMDNLTVNATFIQLFDKAEKIQHLMTETSQILKQEGECLQVVETLLPEILPQVEREECLRAMVIELGEARRRHLIRDHLQLQTQLGHHHLHQLMDW